MAIKANDKIYFDSDCLSCFLWTNSVAQILLQLYKNNIYVPGIVKDEIYKIPVLKSRLQPYIDKNVIKEDIMPLSSDEFKLFRHLIIGDDDNPKIDKGEAAVISYAYCNDSMMASNNLSDISYYIKYYKLKNLTVADILYEANVKGIITEDEAEAYWQEMLLKRRRKLPNTSYKDWVKLNKKKVKLACV